MNGKTVKILFWVTTGLLSIMMLASASFYFIKYNEVASEFRSVNFPTFIIIPLAILKILGVIAILTRLNKSILEWAYAGFFFNFLLAFSAHLQAEDGEHYGAMVALILLLSSYFLGKRIS